jgi:hypothetical protein
MATKRIEILGGKQDFDIRRGITFGPFQHQLTVLDSSTVPPTAVPLDLTGYEFRGQIRRNERSSSVIAEFSFDNYDPVNGEYEFWLSDEQTSVLPAGSTMGAAQSNYVYDIEMESPDGDVTSLLYGKIRVQAEVTR